MNEYDLERQRMRARRDSFFGVIDFAGRAYLYWILAFAAFVLIMSIPAGIAYLSEDHESPAEQLRQFNQNVCVNDPTPAYASYCSTGDWNQDGTVDGRDAESAPAS